MIKHFFNSEKCLIIGNVTLLLFILTTVFAARPRADPIVISIQHSQEPVESLMDATQETFTESHTSATSGIDNNIVDTTLPINIQEYCRQYAEEYGLSQYLLIAMIEKESSGNPNAKNGNCLGLMQVSSYWHSDRMKRLGCKSLYNPDQNIHVGSDYMSELLYRYNDNTTLALMVYNMGDKKALEFYNQGVTSKYAISIIQRAADLSKLHSADQEDYTWN